MAKKSRRERVIADTMVFYYLGSSTISKSDFMSEKEELFATPVNVYEIIAGVDVSNWRGRKQAARAILDYSDGMLDDPERHLVKLFGSEPPYGDLPWLDACKALSDAKTAAELRRGVADFTNKVIRTVKYDIAAASKKKHYQEFVDEIIDACDSELPGYAVAARANDDLPILPKDKRAEFRDKMRSSRFFAEMLLFAVGGRFKLLTGKWPEKEKLSQALSALTPYIAVYGEYIYGLLATRRKPKENDWGDMELFIYLQPGIFLATAEKKWVTFATEAGLGSRVRKIVPIVK